MVIPELIDDTICNHLLSEDKVYHLRISELDKGLCKKILHAYKQKSYIDRDEINTIRNLYVTINNAKT
jgi:hypothetical protein